MKNLLLLIFPLILGINVDAQSTSLKGSVKDHNGEGIKKVEIYVDMKQIKESTNKKGEYSFDHPMEFQLLTIYSPKHGFIHWTYKGEEKIDFVFPEDSEPLKKSSFLGMGYTDLKNIPEHERNFYANYGSILDILDNRFREVQVKDGQILIVNRGVNSAMVQEPFVLVNDIPTDIANLETIPTSEIKSIRVVSKGSEAAAYGQRGANGVILIRLKEAEDERN